MSNGKKKKKKKKKKKHDGVDNFFVHNDFFLKLKIGQLLFVLDRFLGHGSGSEGRQRESIIRIITHGRMEKGSEEEGGGEEGGGEEGGREEGNGEEEWG